MQNFLTVKLNRFCFLHSFHDLEAATALLNIKIAGEWTIILKYVDSP